MSKRKRNNSSAPANFLVKSDGLEVPFSFEKLARSLLRAGATAGMVEHIMGEVQAQLYNGISSKRIYQIAFRLLKRQQDRSIAARYNLKRAIFEMGPDGLMFELYVGRLLEVMGYKTEVGPILQGHCVTHEVDVVAQKGDEFLLVECKFHQKPGVKSGVQVPLYCRSRFNDVEDLWSMTEATKGRHVKGWIVTNTRFSDDALAYGSCSGMRMVAWGEPAEQNLEDLIEKHRAFPVTCMTTLTKAQKRKLMEMDIILCSELMDQQEKLNLLRIKPATLKRVKKELLQLNAERLRKATRYI